MFGSDAQPTQPQACPTCGTNQDFGESLSHQVREEGLEFLWKCDECEHKFTTLSEIDAEAEVDHTFMWVEQDNDVTQILHIEGDEESPGVVTKRAQFNMMECESYEVHGREWAISRLYDIFDTNYEFSEEREGQIQIPGVESEREG